MPRARGPPRDARERSRSGVAGRGHSGTASHASHATLEEHPYTVVSRAGQLLVRLSGAPTLDFALGPDGTIRGDGTARLVNGHRKTGENTLGDPTYAGSSDTCGFGAPAPRLARKTRR